MKMIAIDFVRKLSSFEVYIQLYTSIEDKVRHGNAEFWVGGKSDDLWSTLKVNGQSPINHEIVEWFATSETLLNSI